MVEWYIYALGAAVFSTAFAVARKKALQNEHALKFESVRTVISAVLLLVFLPFISLDVPLNVIVMVYIIALIAAVGIVLMAKSFRHMQISCLYPLMNIKPMFVLVFAYFFLAEKVSTKNVAGIFVLLLGAYALESDHHFRDLTEPIKNLFKSRHSLYVIAALLLFSITSLMDKFIISNYLDPLTFMFLVWVFIALNVNIIHGTLHGFKEIKEYVKKITCLPFLVSIFSILSDLLYLFALKSAYVSLVTPVIMMSTLFVVLIGGKFFNEKNIAYRLMISAFMLVGAYLIIT